MHEMNDSDRAECRPAVFLDRDGTLIEDRWNLRQPADVRFFPETMSALWLLQQDLRLFIVSNQVGVAEGALTCAEVDEVNDHPCDVELAENVGARGIYVLTGHGRKHCRELTGNPLIVAGIAEATEWIMCDREIFDEES